jgi:uncharacterized protein
MTLFVEKPAPVRRRTHKSSPRPRHDAVAHVRPEAKVLVLAKTPTGMGARTKLGHAIGAPGAALVYHRLLERTLRHLARGDVFPVVAVPPRASEFGTLASRSRVRTEMQPRGDQGARIVACMRRERGPCIVVDSDAPAIDAILVRHAAQSLGLYDVVLGPTWNGGYYLAGLRAPAYAFRVFDKVRWGTSHVLDDTLARVPAHWKVGLLPVLADANDPAVMAEAAEDYAPPRRRSSSLGMISMKLQGR